jgi:hypothetical protein
LLPSGANQADRHKLLLVVGRCFLYLALPGTFSQVGGDQHPPSSQGIKSTVGMVRWVK